MARTACAALPAMRARVRLAQQPGPTHSPTLAALAGHGSDETYGCGEFCVTSHVWDVNGRSYSLSLGPAPGSYFGCSDQVLQGTTPNEHGTWVRCRRRPAERAAPPVAARLPPVPAALQARA